MLSKPPQQTSFAFLKGIEDWIQKSPRSSSYWVPRNLFHRIDRQAQPAPEIQCQLRVERWQEGPKHCRIGSGEKRQRRQKTLTTLLKGVLCVLLKRIGCAFRKLLRVVASFPKWVLGVPQKLQYLKENFRRYTSVRKFLEFGLHFS